MLLREFTSNFFSLDSRFAKTFKPFLFSPGKITNAFIEGKRVSYANPIRWYLVISLLHFFMMSQVLQPTIKDMKQRTFMGEAVELDASEFDSLLNIPDTTDAFPFSNSQQKIVNHLIENTSASDNQIYDTLKLERTWLSEFATKKSIRTSRETTASLNNYLLSQVPLFVFFMLPIYAFFLKLFFWRKGLYISHLIHSIHLHSFLFLLGTIGWLLALFFNDVEGIAVPVITLATFFYAVISFRKVYGVKLLWGTFRAFWIGFFYFIALSTVMVAGMIISLALI